MKVFPKKSLGQNFLIDKNIIEKIVEIGSIKKNDKVLEVGPGNGELTEYILKKNPKKLFVIEKDTNLAKYLKEKFNEKINIINEDILRTYESSISKDKIIVFGNLPYNISTQILSKWITNDVEKKWYKKFILMFQKEVADRILAKTNSSSYGRLSILSNWKLEVKKVLDIKASCFKPKPKIDSTLLSFTPKEKIFLIKNPKNLEKITRIFFNQRRKMIKNPLKQIFKDPYKIVDKLKLNINLRPQNLEPLTYFKITEEYEKLIN